ncbi:MAG: hypothetical protein ABS46_17360 [Cytophagaceae bacterium SCN 52-12]|nr:MAG: hypothetical protein ABS46_17360 [Cytophagaceae bacterium SCN 52-12]
MKVAVISTSPRKESNTLKAAKFLADLAGNHAGPEVTLTHFEDADIPWVGRGEVNPGNLSAFQESLISAWKAADLVLFIVPEYNWITGGELINAFHQLGSRHFRALFDNKVFAFAGVSDGKGGRRPCIEMTTLVNKLISVLGGHSFVSPKIFESQRTQDALDEDGQSKGDVSYEKAAVNFVAYSIKAAERWKAGQIS